MKDNLISVYLKIHRSLTSNHTAEKGFSLIELMMAIAIASIVLAGIYSVHASLTRSYTTQTVTAEIQQTIRAGIDFMVEDIMMAGLDSTNSSGAGIELASSSSIRF